MLSSSRMEPDRQHTLRSLYIPEDSAPPCWCDHVDDDHLLERWDPPQAGPDDPQGRYPRAVVICKGCFRVMMAFTIHELEKKRIVMQALASKNPLAEAGVRQIDALIAAADHFYSPEEWKAAMAKVEAVRVEVDQIIILAGLSDKPQA